MQAGGQCHGAICGGRLVRRALAPWMAMAVLLLGPSLATAYNPAAGDYAKEHPLDVRVVTYNTQQNFIADATRDAAFDRVLTVLAADVFVLQEMPVAVTAATIVARFNASFPIGGSGWQAFNGKSDGFIRTVIVSRYPLTLTRNDTIPASDVRGVTIALVDLPNALHTRDLYLLGVHLKAFSGTAEDAQRQKSADAIAAWLGDARQAGGNVTLAANTPMIVLGDFNFVGSLQPATTIITGDIMDNATYGPDVKGDWDMTNITDLQPADPFTGDTDTWSSTSTNPTSRLDRFFYTDSVVTVAHSFILNTLAMTSGARSAAGLQLNDTKSSSTSDHLPTGMDLHFSSLRNCNNPFADLDGDADVDQTDFAVWQKCVTNDGVTFPSSACICLDRDGDGDVDSSELDPFLNCYSGPAVPAATGCDGAP